MALDSLVRRGVRLAHRLTKSLQERVEHHAWVGQDGFGAPEWAAPHRRLALVEEESRQVLLADGRVVEVRYKVTFLEPVEPNGAEGRSEPVDARDKIVVHGGVTGPILEVSGLHDPEHGRSYLLEVSLGVGTANR